MYGPVTRTLKNMRCGFGYILEGLMCFLESWTFIFLENTSFPNLMPYLDYMAAPGFHPVVSNKLMSAWDI